MVEWKYHDSDALLYTVQWEIFKQCKLSHILYEASRHKYINYEILRLKISTMSNFEWAILTRGNGTEAMAFYQHFWLLDDLPDPSKLLSASLSPVVITRL